jgi:hypothetical protein
VDHQGPKENRENLDSKEVLGPGVVLDLMAQKEIKAHPDFLEIQENKAGRELRENPEDLETMVKKETLGHLVTLEFEEKLDRKDP